MVTFAFSRLSLLHKFLLHLNSLHFRCKQRCELETHQKSYNPLKELISHPTTYQLLIPVYYNTLSPTLLIIDQNTYTTTRPYNLFKCSVTHRITQRNTSLPTHHCKLHKNRATHPPKKRPIKCRINLTEFFLGADRYSLIDIFRPYSKPFNYLEQKYQRR